MRGIVFNSHGTYTQTHTHTPFPAGHDKKHSVLFLFCGRVYVRPHTEMKSATIFMSEILISAGISFRFDFKLTHKSHWHTRMTEAAGSW